MLALLLSACLASKPVDNRPFSNIRDVASLEGTYSNLGEGAPHQPKVHLSWVIWGGHELPHEAIESIEVKALDGSTLRVRAFGDGGVLKKDSIFVRGKDFEIQDGRITLRHHAGIAGFHDGEVLVGPYYGFEELGLDDRGEGKYRSDMNVAGLVFLFLPMALGVSEEVRFVRMPQPNQPR